MYLKKKWQGKLAHDILSSKRRNSLQITNYKNYVHEDPIKIHAYMAYAYFHAKTEKEAELISFRMQRRK